MLYRDFLAGCANSEDFVTEIRIPVDTLPVSR